MKWSLKKLAPQIYLLEFDNKYDLCMHFLRRQEFYESPNLNFRNSSFRLLDYMEWYSKQGNGSFSYPIDWSGFNIPSQVLDKFYFTIIPDWNKYDAFMQKIYELIKTSDEVFCLIGSVSGDKETVQHELSHAMYSLNPNYKNELNSYTNTDPKENKIYDCLVKYLLSIGYSDYVIEDEYYAYMATGLNQEMLDEFKSIKISMKDLNKHIKEYKKIFKKYSGQLE